MLGKARCLKLQILSTSYWNLSKTNAHLAIFRQGGIICRSSRARPFRGVPVESESYCMCRQSDTLCIQASFVCSGIGISPWRAMYILSRGIGGWWKTKTRWLAASRRRRHGVWVNLVRRGRRCIQVVSILQQAHGAVGPTGLEAVREISSLNSSCAFSIANGSVRDLGRSQ